MSAAKVAGGSWPQWIMATIAVGAMLLSIVSLWLSSAFATRDEVAALRVEMADARRDIVVMKRDVEANKQIGAGMGALLPQVAVANARLEDLGKQLDRLLNGGQQQ